MRVEGCHPGCYYYTDSCFRKDCNMRHVPAHKVIGDAGKPGQIINPINTDIMDEMMNLPASVQHMHRTGFTPDMPQTQTPAVTAANHKPAHGGYPTPAPYSTDWTPQTR